MIYTEDRNPMKTRDEVIRGLVDAGLGDVITKLEPVMKPTILLNPEATEMDAMGLGESRLGGDPDLPDDVVWPEYKGRPLTFIAQINLADVAPFAAAKELPAQGWLWFFYDADEQPWGFEEQAGCSRVIYRESGTLVRRQRPATPPGYVSEFEAPESFSPCRVKFEEYESIRSQIDEVRGELGIDPGLFDKFEEYLDEEFNDDEGSENPWSERSLLRGFPDQVQGDLGEECTMTVNHLLGLPAPQREEDFRSLECEWNLLLQVGSEDKCDMMWGDVGCLYFMIRDEDLAARRFDRHWLVLQCG